MSERYIVLDSATGDEVGAIHFTGAEPDEMILQTLIDGGCLPLDSDPGEFTIDHAYFLADGATVVLDQEGTPVLTLEPEDESEDDAEDADDENPDDDDEDDDDIDEDEDEPEN